MIRNFDFSDLYLKKLKGKSETPRSQNKKKLEFGWVKMKKNLDEGLR